jgi:hypothetical protein
MVTLNHAVAGRLTRAATMSSASFTWTSIVLDAAVGEFNRLTGRGRPIKHVRR